MYPASQILHVVTNSAEHITKHLQDEGQAQSPQTAALRKQHDYLDTHVASQRGVFADTAVDDHQESHKRKHSERSLDKPAHRERDLVPTSLGKRKWHAKSSRDRWSLRRSQGWMLMNMHNLCCSSIRTLYYAIYKRRLDCRKGMCPRSTYPL